MNRMISSLSPFGALSLSISVSKPYLYWSTSIRRTCSMVSCTAGISILHSCRSQGPAVSRLASRPLSREDGCRIHVRLRKYVSFTPFFPCVPSHHLPASSGGRPFLSFCRDLFQRLCKGFDLLIRRRKPNGNAQRSHLIAKPHGREHMAGTHLA